MWEQVVVGLRLYSVVLPLLSVGMLWSIYLDATGRELFNRGKLQLIAQELQEAGIEPTSGEVVVSVIKGALLRAIPFVSAPDDDRELMWWAYGTVRAARKLDGPGPGSSHEAALAIARSPTDVADSGRIVEERLQAVKDELAEIRRLPAKDWIVALRDLEGNVGVLKWEKVLKGYPRARPRLKLIFPEFGTFLDFVGRGTALGLLAGLLIDLGEWFSGPGPAATLGPVIGALLGGLWHGAHLTRILAHPTTAPRNFFTRRPTVSYALVLLLVTVLGLAIPLAAGVVSR